MGIGKLSLYFSEWFLLGDADSWVETPIILFVWHCLFFSGVAMYLVSTVWYFGFRDTLLTSETATLYYRYFSLVSCSEMIILLAVLAGLHYRYLL